MCSSDLQCLKVFEDSELVVRQIKNECQTKHPRLRAYRNEVWDMIENFFLSVLMHLVSSAMCLFLRNLDSSTVWCGCDVKIWPLFQFKTFKTKAPTSPDHSSLTRPRVNHKSRFLSPLPCLIPCPVRPVCLHLVPVLAVLLQAVVQTRAPTPRLCGML